MRGVYCSWIYSLQISKNYYNMRNQKRQFIICALNQEVKLFNSTRYFKSQFEKKKLIALQIHGKTVLTVLSHVSFRRYYKNQTKGLEQTICNLSLKSESNIYSHTLILIRQGAKTKSLIWFQSHIMGSLHLQVIVYIRCCHLITKGPQAL